MEFYNIGNKSVRLSSIVYIEEDNDNAMSSIVFTESREVKIPIPKATLIKIIERNIQEKGQHFAG